VKVFDEVHKGVIDPKQKEHLKLGYRGQDLLKDQLLLNSTDLLQLLLSLNLFPALSKSRDYPRLCQYLLTIFMYDHTKIVWSMALYLTEKHRIQKLIEEKVKKN
jgi:hypothetical protein